MSKFQSFLIIVFLGMFGYFKYNEMLVQLDTYELKEQEHVDTLYGIYQSNMSNCLSQAKENKKSNQEINDTCIDTLNSSIVANWLKDYGYGYLLEDRLVVNPNE